VNYSKNKYKIIFFLFLFIINFPLWANPEKNITLPKLLEVSGSLNGISVFLRQVDLTINQERITNPEEALSEYEKELYLKDLTYNGIVEKLMIDLGEKLSPNTQDYLLKLYDLEIIKRQINAEAESATPEGITNLTRYFQTLQKTPPSKKKIRLIHELESAFMATEMSIYSIVSFTRARTETVLKYRNQWNSENIQKLDYQFSKMSDNLEKPTRNQMRMAYLYIYKDFSIDELEELLLHAKDEKRINYTVSFLDSFNRIVVEGVKKGLLSVLKYREKSET